MQDTGFSSHLPCGVGLFAVRTVDEAAAAIELISQDYKKHADGARQMAEAFLAPRIVLGRFMSELGLR